LFHQLFVKAELTVANSTVHLTDQNLSIHGGASKHAVDIVKAFNHAKNHANTHQKVGNRAKADKAHVQGRS